MEKVAVLLAFVAALLGGCSSIETRIEDFPELAVSYHEVSHEEIVRRCHAGMPPWMKALGGIPMACAEINFRTKTCSIYWTAAFAGEKKHEEEHCRGGDHDGMLKKKWENYKKSLPKNTRLARHPLGADFL